MVLYETKSLPWQSILTNYSAIQGGNRPISDKLENTFKPFKDKFTNFILPRRGWLNTQSLIKFNYYFYFRVYVRNLHYPRFRSFAILLDQPAFSIPNDGWVYAVCFYKRKLLLTRPDMPCCSSRNLQIPGISLSHLTWHCHRFDWFNRTLYFKGRHSTTPPLSCSTTRHNRYYQQLEILYLLQQFFVPFQPCCKFICRSNFIKSLFPQYCLYLYDFCFCVNHLLFESLFRSALPHRCFRRNDFR